MNKGGVACTEYKGIELFRSAEPCGPHLSIGCTKHGPSDGHWRQAQWLCPPALAGRPHSSKSAVSFPAETCVPALGHTCSIAGQSGAGRRKQVPVDCESSVWLQI